MNIIPFVKREKVGRHPLFQPAGKNRNQDRVRAFMGEGYSCGVEFGDNCAGSCVRCPRLVSCAAPVSVVAKAMPRTLRARLR